MRATRLVICVVVGVSVVPVARAGEWPRFRGPNGTGLALDAHPPRELSEDTLEWSAQVPFGRSSPVVSETAVYLTAAGETAFSVLALDRSTGRLLWRSEFERERVARMHPGNDSSSPSPATDGANVYAFFQESGLVSFDAEGAERWRLPLGPFTNYHGLASSPILGAGLVLLVCDQSFGSFVIAVDAETGEVRWRTERPGREDSWSTPTLYPGPGAPEALLVAGSRWVDAYALDDGALLWSLGGVGAATVPSPVLADGRLFVSGIDVTGMAPGSFESFAAQHDADGDGAVSADELAGVPTYGDGGFGYFDVDRDGKLTRAEWEVVKARLETSGWGAFGLRLRGTATPPEILWNYRKNVDFTTSGIVVKGVFFGAAGSILTSLDAATGERLRRGRLVPSGELRASPVAADGRIYFAMRDGRVVVVSAEPRWEVLAVNDLGQPIDATPAIAGNQILVRTKSHLHSFRGPDAAPPPAPAGKPLRPELAARGESEIAP